MVPKRPFHPTEVSRRQLLVTTGAFLAGGSVVATAGSGSARGVVDTRALQIPPAEYQGEDGTVADLPVEIYGSYEFDVAEGNTLTLSLAVAPGTGSSNFQTIDETSEPLAATSGAGQYTLTGSLLDHDALEAQQFSAEPEQTTTVELPVRVLLDITHDGESVVQALAETIATVEVTNTSVQASAAVMGEGQVGIEV